MSQPHEPTLGIIGGAGVGAAAQLYIDVSARLSCRYRQVLPQIALWNLPMSDRKPSVPSWAERTAPRPQPRRRRSSPRASTAWPTRARPSGLDAVQFATARGRAQVGAGGPALRGHDRGDGRGRTGPRPRACGPDRDRRRPTYGGHYDGHGVEMIEPAARATAEVATLDRPDRRRAARSSRLQRLLGAHRAHPRARGRRRRRPYRRGRADRRRGGITAPRIVESLACLADSCALELAPAHAVWPPSPTERSAQRPR